ncbi:hypothetical protein J2X68_001051 [Streptomyces sp. 3330]|uniref:DUF4232 domain-containing protein n=1 Tax=Streptomyces sp. 3330 TaxID=2817755 RepID=UPI002856359D|nr:DUF4232 domain-containing protein [Streptomyces sp. 3330]MDR6974373.1 hypothetical protein [Streptomyces sp. 3330]
MNALRHRSTLLATAGAAVLALSLTGCQDGTDTDSAAQTASATAEATQGQATGTTAPAGSAGSNGSTAGGSTGSAGGSDSDTASTSTPVCAAGDVGITAATQDGPPYTHLVLTAKNTSGHSCRLTGFPRIQFLESHKQDVPAVAKSKPGAPVVLQAGEPAYALVKLSDGGTDEENEPVSAFSVMLEGDSTVIAVTAPGSDGVAVDPAKALTGYWTPELRNGADDF